MLRSIYTITFLLCFKTLAIAQTGELQGKITDQNGKAVELANVVVEQNGTIKGGAEADFDGTYSIKPLQAGTYVVIVSYVGYQTSITTGVKIKANITTFLNVTLDIWDDIFVCGPMGVNYKIPLYQKDNTTQGVSLSGDDIYLTHHNRR